MRRALVVLLLIGCSSSPSTRVEVPVDGELTWYGSIGPLVTQRCASCHRPGEIGPFPLERYEQLKTILPSIRDAVQSRRMPPFPPEQSPASGCPPIDDGRKMSEPERAALLAWLDAGAPEGTKRELPRAKAPQPLGAPTQRFQMSEPYTTKGNGDDYRCFLIRTTNVVALPVAALSVEPGNRTVVHHSAVYLVPPERLDAVRALDENAEGPGFDCFGGVGVDGAYPAALWVPGNDAPLVPPRTSVGYYLPVGWGLVMQNHYYSTGPAEDQSSVALYQGDFLFPEVPHAGILGETNFTLPPRSSTMVEKATVVRRTDAPYALLNEANAGSIYAVWGHMHLRGQSLELDVIHADGSEQCLLRIPQWDFHWQSLYRLEHPVALHEGETVRLRCHFTNDSDTEILYGENTGNEMCFGTISMTGP